MRGFNEGGFFFETLDGAPTIGVYPCKCSHIHVPLLNCCSSSWSSPSSDADLPCNRYAINSRTASFLQCRHRNLLAASIISFSPATRIIFFDPLVCAVMFPGRGRQSCGSGASLAQQPVAFSRESFVLGFHRFVMAVKSRWRGRVCAILRFWGVGEALSCSFRTSRCSPVCLGSVISIERSWNS